jgi:aminoglycoside phosphotransferase (APT) family kinase protein
MSSSTPVAGLRETPVGGSLDEARLGDWLRVNVRDFEGPMDVRQFAGGQSNPTYLIQTASHRYVLRRKPPGKLLPSAHAVDREYRVLEALKGSDVPVAETYALCEDQEVIGSSFYVMSYVEGRIFWEATLPDVAPSDRRAIYQEMVRVQAALHSVNYEAVGLGDYGRAGAYVERQVTRWSQQYRASQTEPIEAMEKLMDWLPRHIPAGEQSGIVHGDFRLDNTIFHPSEPRILAVLDWELSTIGNPMVDFAYFCMRYHIPDTAFKGLGGVDTRALMIPSEAECIAQYCRLRGIDSVSSKDWAYYMAFCMFRLAAILQGIMARAMQGNASSDTALEAGRRTRPLAELAWSLVERSFA